MPATYANPNGIDIISIERGKEKIACIRDWGYIRDDNKYSSALRLAAQKRNAGQETDYTGENGEQIAAWLGEKFPELIGAKVFIKRMSSSGFDWPVIIK